MRKFLLAGVATVAMTGMAGAAGLEPQQPSTSHNIRDTAQPGRVIVRLDGYFFAAIGFSSNTNDKATTLVGGVPRTAKVDPYGIVSTFRFFPSFDAQTTGGLRYGALAEVRSNNNTAGVGGGVGTPGQRTSNTLFVNRTRGYVGGDNWGTFLIGMTDGPAATLRTGLIEAQVADGGWNGWAPGLTRGVNPYQFAIGGGYEYSSQKIIYLTPNFSGFRAGVSFAPSTASNQTGEGGALLAGGAARAATTVAPFGITAAGGFANADFNRWRNQIQVAANYAFPLGPVAMQAHVGYIGSSAIKSAIPAAAGATGVAALTSARGQSVLAAGLQATYMGFTLGGYMNTGTFNGNGNLSIAGEKAATVWSVGLGYTMGPWEAGFHYIAAATPGSLGVTGVGAAAGRQQQFNNGVGLGVTYNWAPGQRLMVEAVLGTAKERGVNLSTDTTIAAGVTKAANAQAIIIGNQFRW